MKRNIYKEMESFIKRIQPNLCYLYSRWQDEKKYEDFKAYSEEMKKLLNKFDTCSLVTWKFTKATKKPFGFEFREYGLQRDIKITMTSKQIEWKALPF